MIREFWIEPVGPEPSFLPHTRRVIGCDNCAHSVFFTMFDVEVDGRRYELCSECARRLKGQSGVVIHRIITIADRDKAQRSLAPRRLPPPRTSPRLKVG